MKRVLAVLVACAIPLAAFSQVNNFQTGLGSMLRITGGTYSTTGFVTQSGSIDPSISTPLQKAYGSLNASAPIAILAPGSGNTGNIIFTGTQTAPNKLRFAVSAPSLINQNVTFTINGTPVTMRITGVSGQLNTNMANLASPEPDEATTVLRTVNITKDTTQTNQIVINGTVATIFPITINLQPNYVGQGGNLAQNPRLGSSLLWRSSGAGTPPNFVAIWQAPLGTVDAFKSVDVAPAGWALRTAADINQDGVDDLIWQNESTGLAVYWTLAADGAPSTATVFASPGVDWRVVDSGTILNPATNAWNGLLWQNVVSGALVGWAYNGPDSVGQVISYGTVPAGWRVGGFVDINGDGFSDIIFQNESTGEIRAWTTNLSGSLDNVFIGIPGSPDWRLAAGGTVSTDGVYGQTTLLFQNSSSGLVAFWGLDGAMPVRFGVLGESAPGWGLIACGRF